MEKHMIKYSNYKGDVYYLHEGISKKGNPTYWFSKNTDGKLVNDIPKDFEIYEEPNGMVYLRKTKTEIISADEVGTVRNSIPKKLNTKVDVEGYRALKAGKILFN